MAEKKWEQLKCEYAPKPHNWKRPIGQRGRKPKFCEKHRPTVSIPGVKAEARELYCVTGKHNWVREPKRGRVPSSCPEHAVITSIKQAPRNSEGLNTLHCEAGNHEWTRPPARGRKPSNCPKHSGPVVGLRSVPVNVIAGSETGDPVTAKRKPGRPRIHATPEEATEAQLQASRERVDRLEGMLKENGTHLSQQTPYILYKKVGEKPGRNGRKATTTWDKVAEHSPLQQAQYVNSHAHDFSSGAYRYERNNRVVVL